MRVIKGNIKYVSFHKSLPSITKEIGGKTNSYILNLPQESAKGLSISDILINIKTFNSAINIADTIEEVNNLLGESIKNFFKFIEAEFFFFDGNNTALLSPGKTASCETSKFFNNAHKEGILDWAFNSRSPRSIPLYKVSSTSQADNHYLIIPLFDGHNPRGIFSVLHNNKVEEEDISIKYIEMLAGCAFQRLNLLINNQEKKSAFNMLQTYQSKLTNDFRLSAIGELAGGVLEEILEPLQVIFSSVDLLHTNNENVELISSIKKQVKKIETSAERLRKFADRNENRIKIFPCNINKLIENYYAIIYSSLEKKQIECILDLEAGLPSILSHSDLINQLLVNVISLITGDLTKASGILIQTELVKDRVKLTFITTEYLPQLKSAAQSNDTTYHIIRQLILRHEGEIETDSRVNSGSRIIFYFPLKRKIRS